MRPRAEHALRRGAGRRGGGHVHTREVRRRPFDAVVAGVHGRADTALAGAVERAGRRLLVAGDAVAPRTALHAYREGDDAGRPRDAGHRRRCRHGRPRRRRAARRRAPTSVLERGERIGGTTALSGGVAWLPANDRTDDTPEQALAYLRALALGDVVDELVEVFAREAGDRSLAGARDAAPLAGDPYPDYHAELDGAREGGRALEPAAYDAPERIRDLIRDAPNRSGSITYAELLAGGADDDELARRDAAGTLTAGKSLLGCLLEACLDAGVELRPAPA